MRNRKTSGSTLILLFIITFTFGCLPQARKEVVGPRQTLTAPPVLPDAAFGERIRVLRGLLVSKELKKQRKEIIEKLLRDYQTLISLTKGHPGGEDLGRIIEILFMNLSLMEDRYLIPTGDLPGNTLPEALSLYSQERKKILDDYLSGNYRSVVDRALELEGRMGADSLTSDIGLAFAVSLSKKGMLTEAVDIGERIVRELEARPDLIHLRANLVEWYLGLGQREKALQAYEKLVDDLDERNGIISRIRKEVLFADETGPDKGEETARPGVPPAGAEADASSGPLKQALEEAERLIENKEFQQAKLLLLRQRIRARETSEIEALDRATASLERAEKLRYSGGEVKPVGDEEPLRPVKILIEEEKYEEAIKRLDEIGEDGKATDGVRELRVVATEKLINRERNRAAKLFLMARNTDEPVKKESLLRSSQKILRDLIEKYPYSKLVDKLSDNIHKVEEALNGMGVKP